MQESDLIIYKNNEGNIIVDAIYKDETLWLSQKSMSKVFDCSIDNISLHLKNIFKEGELDENSVVEEASVTASDGKKYKTKIYNLDVIIAVGGNKYDTKYFDELLERIKTIRVSERMSYQKITDLFIATSTDYNPKSEEAYTFFKIVQNKLHFAISGHTAAELIYSRTDSNKEHMGLTSWLSCTK